MPPKNSAELDDLIYAIFERRKGMDKAKLSPKDRLLLERYDKEAGVTR